MCCSVKRLQITLKIRVFFPQQVVIYKLFLFPLFLFHKKGDIMSTTEQENECQIRLMNYFFSQYVLPLFLARKIESATKQRNLTFKYFIIKKIFFRKKKIDKRAASFPTKSGRDVSNETKEFVFDIMVLYSFFSFFLFSQKVDVMSATEQEKLYLTLRCCIHFFLFFFFHKRWT